MTVVVVTSGDPNSEASLSVYATDDLIVLIDLAHL